MISNPRRRETDAVRDRDFRKLKARIWRQSVHTGTVLVFLLGAALFCALSPSISTWQAADRAALAAGLEYLTPITGWRGTAWIIGIFFAGLILIYLIARLDYAARIRRLEPPVSVEERLVHDFVYGDDHYTPYEPAYVPAHRLSPSQFEYEVARVIYAQTGLETRVVGGSGDGGVDVEVLRNRRVVGIVQCKRYDPSRTLPPGHIRELYAVKVQRNVSVAYLVTTAAMSTAAHTEAGRLGIRLITGEDFERMRRQQTSVIVRPEQTRFMPPSQTYLPPPQRRSLWDD